MLRLLLFLISYNLSAQTFFVRSGEILGIFERYGVRECNESDKIRLVTGSEFIRAAASANLTIATYSELNKAKTKFEDTSWQRKSLLGIEIFGWVTTALISSDLVKIDERPYKSLAPLVSGGLRYATTLIKPPKIEVPPLRPPIVQISPGECVENTIYAYLK